MEKTVWTRSFGYSGNLKSKIQNRKLVGIVALGIALAMCGLWPMRSSHLRSLRLASYSSETVPIWAPGGRYSVVSSVISAILKARI
jgi:hypothetical protein